MEWTSPPLDIDTLLRNETRIVALNPDWINVDAERFQFKSGGDCNGVTDRMRGVDVFDPEICDPVYVWQDTKGRLFIADGHQRMGLLKRCREQGQIENAFLPAIIYKESDGITAEMMKVKAAERNIAQGSIAQGSGKPIDVANIIRNHGPLPKSIPPNSDLVRRGKWLAELDEDVFKAVANGKLSEEFGAIIAETACQSTLEDEEKVELQHALLKEFLTPDSKPKNADEARFIARDVLRHGFTKTTQLGMFGDEELTESNRPERMQIMKATKKLLKEKARMLKQLDENAQEIREDFGADSLDMRKVMRERNLYRVARLLIDKGWFQSEDEQSNVLDASSSKLKHMRNSSDEEAVQRFVTLMEPVINKYANSLKAARAAGQKKGDGQKVLAGIALEFSQKFVGELETTHLGAQLLRSMDALTRERDSAESAMTFAQ